MRVTYRQQSELQQLRELAVEDYPADQRDAESLKKAMTGVERVFVVQSIAPETATWSKGIVAAAKSASVAHLIRIFNMATGPRLGSDIAAMHYDSDEMFKSSRCSYTLLKTANYCRNLFYSALTSSATLISRCRSATPH